MTTSHMILITFIIILLHSPLFQTSNETDMLALLAIKEQIFHDPHKILESWNDSLHFCKWPGVSCSHLHQRVRTLNLSSLGLAGTLSPHISNLTFLKGLNLELNDFHGEIPPEIGGLFRLRHLNLSHNSFSGEIPANLSGCSSLVVIRLGWNRLTGIVPRQLGNLQKVETIQLHYNNFSGKFSQSFGNFSSIRSFSFAANNFHGEIPAVLGKLKTLNFLGLGLNQFSGMIPHEICNLSSLVALSVPHNLFEGILPLDLGFKFNLPDLQVLNVGHNLLTGPLPVSLSNASNLIEFDITGNRFTGKILIDFRGLSNLGSLILADNPLGIGEYSDILFLNSLTNCRNLQVLDLSNCGFGGTLPNSVSKFSTNLLSLRLGGNRISGPIGVGIANLVNLIELQLQKNKLTGSIPAVLGNLFKLQMLDLSENGLSGYIPSSLSKLRQLHSLHLNRNFMNGSIPLSFGEFQHLQELDLSYNHLSGHIPDFLQGLSFKNLNLSFNQFEGQIPREGIFRNASAFSITGNDKLCGGIPDLGQSMCPKNELKIRMIPLICGVLALVLIISFLTICCLWRKRMDPSVFSESEIRLFSKLTYDSLHKATDGFSSANLIGVSTSGSVYKATLESDQTVVALKVFDLHSQANIKLLTAELRALRSIRHRNLVRIYTTLSATDHSGNEFKALVYEFMLNGSLESWLHSNENLRILGLIQRLSIAIDVASALDHLHHHCDRTIIHCHLKPSNVLLDDEMNAHVGDFGLSKFISREITGYSSPEYSQGSKYSPDGDVYTFGILLLEIFTGKKPIDDTFGDGLNLHDYVKTALPEAVEEILDAAIVLSSTRNGTTFPVSDIAAQAKIDQERECLISIMRIGVACSMESPKERMDIADVVKELQLIKDILLASSTTQCSSTSGSLRFDGSSSRSAANNWQNVL